MRDALQSRRVPGFRTTAIDDAPTTEAQGRRSLHPVLLEAEAEVRLLYGSRSLPCRRTFVKQLIGPGSFGMVGHWPDPGGHVVVDPGVPFHDAEFDVEVSEPPDGLGVIGEPLKPRSRTDFKDGALALQAGDRSVDPVAVRVNERFVALARGM